ncbi:HCNGP family protein [Babesia ovis]|uniref:HCNGP family protein n=1 Tax=Babesia ovis TaxID=5869 RepID=A0A9W5TCY0_BABOV|nr:HCNGP family protein [Babesia ovis]
MSQKSCRYDKTRRLAHESQQTIRHLKQLHEQGCTINSNIENSMDFKNPYLLEKVMKVFSIEEYSTNYKKDVYDPDYYVMLANDTGQDTRSSQQNVQVDVPLEDTEGKSRQGNRRRSGWSPEPEH